MSLTTTCISVLLVLQKFFSSKQDPSPWTLTGNFDASIDVTSVKLAPVKIIQESSQDSSSELIDVVTVGEDSKVLSTTLVSPKYNASTSILRKDQQRLPLATKENNVYDANNTMLKNTPVKSIPFSPSQVGTLIAVECFKWFLACSSDCGFSRSSFTIQMLTVYKNCYCFFFFNLHLGILVVKKALKL